MLKHLDDGVGRIVGTLKQENVFDNTLLIYLTDNGGAAAMHANNAPLRGFKQQDYEGGIRVPFVVSWPKRLSGGTTCDVPVFSIDILPTALAAAGVAVPADRTLDGKDMLPALTGRVDSLRDRMFWSSGGSEGKWAIRSSRWKLVGQQAEVELFDLEADLGETTDLAAKHPEQVAELAGLYDAWLAEMADPASGSPKRWSPDAESGKSKKKDSRSRKVEDE
jgi:arylsulfatase A-like enzyme